MGSILVTGTLAYDDICFHADHWSRETRNIKLTRLESSYGGCAMNIAYNLKKLGLEPLPVVHAGDLDFAAYATHLAELGVNDIGVIRVADARCSKGIIFTGPDGTQITAFYPGPATTHQSVERIEALGGNHAIDASIIAPDLPESMLEIAIALQDTRNRFWCPGQYADRLTEPLIRSAASNVDTLIVNRHEFEAMEQTVRGVANLFQVLVITEGPGPVTLVTDGGSTTVAVPKTQMIDPTGCGDAFTAGFVTGQLGGRTLPDCALEGIGLAARCLVCYGAQAH